MTNWKTVYITVSKVVTESYCSKLSLWKLSMTSKKSTGKLEVDVQKLRDEGSWKKLIELTEGGKVGINGDITCSKFIKKFSISN